MRKPRRIAVIGSAVMDLTTFTDQFPRPGETVCGKNFDLGFGGKGANQAVAARLCGAEVQMVAKVGADLFGPATIKNLESFGIDASHVHMVEGVPTGAAPIFVESNGQNRIVVVKGANDSLSPADIERAAPLLSQADCLVLQLEIPLETVYAAIRFAKAHGARVILNPAPSQPLDMSAAAKADYFIPNESEAEALTKMPVRNPEDAKACARFLLDQGFPKVVITLGAQGALLAARDAMEFIPAFPVKTKDTTGAGDAFIGSFAAFLCEGLPEREALTRASLYAALSTTQVGTQKSFAKGAEFERIWERRAAASVSN